MCSLRYMLLLCNACSLRYVLLLCNATKTWSWDAKKRRKSTVKIARKTHGLPGVVVQLHVQEVCEKQDMRHMRVGPQVYLPNPRFSIHINPWIPLVPLLLVSLPSSWTPGNLLKRSSNMLRPPSPERHEPRTKKTPGKTCRACLGPTSGMDCGADAMGAAMSDGKL